MFQWCTVHKLTTTRWRYFKWNIPARPAHNRRTPNDPGNKPRFEDLQVSKEDVTRPLRTFPLGSSGGPDAITPQHIRDFLAGSKVDSLQRAMVDFLNLTLADASSALPMTELHRPAEPTIQWGSRGSRLPNALLYYIFSAWNCGFTLTN